VRWLVGVLGKYPPSEFVKWRFVGMDLNGLKHRKNLLTGRKSKAVTERCFSDGARAVTKSCLFRAAVIS
jgi:hypothetical protein